MKPRFSARRPLRREVPTLAIAFAVPALLLALMPSTSPLKVKEGNSECTCALVELDEQTEERLVSVARAAWRLGEDKGTRKRIDLFAVPLLARPMMPALAEVVTRVGEALPQAFSAPDVMPPTLAAPSPAPLAPDPAAGKRAETFPRAEMLRLDRVQPPR